MPGARRVATRFNEISAIDIAGEWRLLNLERDDALGKLA
jgi:hypothetical protein